MEHTDRTALVIGITGSFGGGVGRELLDRGWHVRAMVRDVERTRRELPEHEHLELVRGDALSREDVARAAEGCAHIVYGFNVPYEQWDRLILEAGAITADVAAERGLHILFPGNVYGLGPDYAGPLDESAPRRATSTKGALRNRLEDLLEEACLRGARCTVLRMGDFFGPRVPPDSMWLAHITEKARDGGAIVYPGPLDSIHQWAYMPDVARIGAELLERADSLEPFSVFHHRGHVVRGAEMVDAIRSALGDSRRSVRRFPWWATLLASPFSAMMRELRDVKYVWDEPIELDDTKLRDELGAPPHTPLEEAVRCALEGLEDAFTG